MKNSFTPLAAIVVAGALTLAGCSGSATPTAITPTATGSSATSSTTVLPVAVDPIANPATAPGLTVSGVLLEDNKDATGADVSDRLQFTIGNDTAIDVVDPEVFYTMTDAVTGAAESYYQVLTGLTVPAHGQVNVYFDNSGEPGHFPENKFSIYRSSTHQVDFTVEVSAANLAIATGTGAKSEGTGEQAAD